MNKRLLLAVIGAGELVQFVLAAGIQVVRSFLPREQSALLTAEMFPENEDGITEEFDDEDDSEIADNSLDPGDRYFVRVPAYARVPRTVH